MFKTALKNHKKTVAAFGIAAGMFSSGFLFESIYPSSSNAAPGLFEFRWDNSTNYRKLYYLQSSSAKRDRSTYFFVLKPRDRKTAILKLSITIPKNFKARITPKKLTLCELHLGGMLSKTKCKKKIPAVFEIDKDLTSIDVFPDNPIPDGGSYAVVMKIFNPDRSGMYQFNALAQAPGDVPLGGYLGSWSIDID